MPRKSLFFTRDAGKYHLLSRRINRQATYSDSVEHALTHIELQDLLEERTRAIAERDDAMAKLRRAHDELESEVRARTKELTRVNHALKIEMADRERIEASLTLALDAAQMGDWDLDLVNDVARRSLRHDQIFGYSHLLPEWGWKVFMGHVFPEDRTAVEAKFRRVMETGEMFNIECRVQWPDNSLHWIASIGRVFHDRHKRPVRMAGVVMEITKLKLAEERLREREKRFRALIENSSDAISLLSADGSIIDTSAATTRILGYTSDEFVGSNGIELIHPDDRELALNTISGLMEHPQTPLTVECRMRHKDGSWIWAECTATNLLKESSVGAIVLNFRNISVRKKAEEELHTAMGLLENLSQRLLQVQESERRYIARELHDEIGQALTALKINLQEMKHNPDTAARAVRTDECVDLVDKTILQVRNLSVELRPSILDDLGLVSALRWYLDRVAHRSGFGQEFTSTGVNSRLPSDLETACFRVAQEALTNIVRHAGAHSVRVRLQQGGGTLRLTVSDDGKGFDVQAAREDARKGKSLGLLGMQERMQLLGGRLDFNSSPGKGTDVIAYFPLSVT